MRYYPNDILVDHGTWLEIDISTKKYPEKVMCIDVDDWERISAIQRKRVSAFSPDRSGKMLYASVNFDLKQKLIHRLVMSEPRSRIDHVDRNGLNNCKINLRLCSASQNAHNTGIRSDNTSSVKGVYFNKKAGKWEATLIKAGKFYYLGGYQLIEDAIAARRNAEVQMLGEFAPIGIQ